MPMGSDTMWDGPFDVEAWDNTVHTMPWTPIDFGPYTLFEIEREGPEHATFIVQYRRNSSGAFAIPLEHLYLAYMPHPDFSPLSYHTPVDLSPLEDPYVIPDNKGSWTLGPWQMGGDPFTDVPNARHAFGTYPNAPTSWEFEPEDGAIAHSFNYWQRQFDPIPDLPDSGTVVFLSTNESLDDWLPAGCVEIRIDEVWQTGGGEGPGGGDPGPTVCPPRPPYPYEDPVLSLAKPKAGAVRFRTQDGGR